MLRTLSFSLLAALVALGPRTAAQVTMEPAAPTVMLEAGQSVARTLTLSYDGASVVPLTLEVLPAVASEDGAPGRREASRLSVYPNPSAGTTTVALTLSEPAEARVAVFDVLGRKVAVLHDGPLRSGPHQWMLGGRSLPSGLYVVRVTGGGSTTAQRFTLVR